MAQVTRADLANKNKGLPFTGTGFTPEESAKVTVVDTTGKELTPDTPIEVNAEGELKGTYYFTVSGGPEDIPLGKYSLFLTDQETKKKSTSVEFDVVDKVTTSPSAPAPSETATPSESATPSTPVTTPAPTQTPSKSPTQKPSATPSETPTESATPSQRPTYSAEPPIARRSAPPSNTPTPSESAAETSPGASESATPSEGAEQQANEKAAAPTLSVDPQNISSENFTAARGGVSITVENVAPNETVTLVVQHAQGKVKQYTSEKSADENGRVVFGVKGEGKPVLGQYNVTATSASTDGLNGTFTVTTNDPGATDNGGGSGSGSGSGDGTGSGSGSSNSALPRTGADATGLALGAGLLVLGTAAIIVTRRRSKASEDPTDLG